jgi:hypothetical protein
MMSRKEMVVFDFLTYLDQLPSPCLHCLVHTSVPLLRFPETLDQEVADDEEEAWSNVPGPMFQEAVDDEAEAEVDGDENGGIGFASMSRVGGVTCIAVGCGRT